MTDIPGVKKFQTIPASLVLLSYLIAAFVSAWVIVTVQAPDVVLVVFMIAPLLVSTIYPRWLYITMSIIGITITLAALSQLSANPVTSLFWVAFLGLITMTTSEALYRMTTNYHQTLFALQTSEQRYSQVVNNSPNPIFTVDPSGRIINWNDACCQIFGYDAEMVIGQHYSILKIDAADYIKRVFAGESLKEIELVYQCRNNQLHYTASRLYPIFDDQGKVEAAVIANTDITERKRAERALQASEEKFRSVFEQSYNGIRLIDKAGKIIAWNRASEYITGYTADEMVGQPIWEVEYMLMPDDEKSPDSLQDLRESEVQLIKSGTTPLMYQPMLRRIRHKNGSIRQIEMILFPVQADGQTILGSVQRDMTEQLQAEQALAQSEARFRAMFESAAIGIAIANEQAQVIQANPMFLEMMGYGMGALHSLHFSDFTYADDVGKEQELVKEMQAGKRKSYQIDKRYIRLDGSTFWGRLTVSQMVIGKQFYYLAAVHNIDAQVQAKIALEESEDRYRQLVELSPDAVIAETHEGGIQYANESALQLFGVKSTDDILGQPSLNFIHKDYYARAFARQEALFLYGHSLPLVQTRICHASGRIVDVEVAATAIMYNGQRAALFIMRDVTERKQTEQALRESEDRYRSLMEFLPDAVSVSNDAGQFLYVNGAMARLVGEDTPNALLGRSILDYTHADYHAITNERRRKIFNDRVPVPLLYKQLIRTDGAMIDVEAITTPVTFNEQPAALTMMRDVTERRRAEIALEESEDRYRSLIETLPVGVVVYEDFNIIYINQVGASLFGAASPYELIGRRVMDFVHAGDMGLIASRMEQLQSSEPGVLTPVEERIVRMDGDVVNVEVISTHMVYNGRERIMAIFQDVTDRKQAQQRHMELALERERMRLLADFIHDTSHEFKTPLSIINTKLYLLERDYHQRHIDGIQEQTNVIKALVDALALMASLDATETFKFSPTRINDLINTIVIGMQNQIDDKGLNLQLTLDDQLPVIQGDPQRLYLALRHIISNAQDFTEAAGNITIETCQQDHTVYVSITDDGIGITAEHLPHIFNRFYRADESRTRRGIGLGLPIARRIIDVHGGSITVDSTPGKGSTFTIALPVSSNDTGQD